MEVCGIVPWGGLFIGYLNDVRVSLRDETPYI